MALVPFSYNWRSLLARRSATVLTVLSIAATVAVVAAMVALQQGFATMFVERGRDDVAVFLRPGADSEGQSSFPKERAQILIKSTPEIAIDPITNQPLASAELFLAVRRFKVDGGETNVSIRGVQPGVFAVHGNALRDLEGRKIAPGADEVMVGAALVDRIRDCEVGDVLTINTTPFRVVGTFTCSGQHDSEIWGDVDRLAEALKRPDYSRIVAVLRPGTDVAALAARLVDDKQVPAKVLTERAYLKSQTGALSGMFFGVGALLGVLMGLGAVFTGTNSMLAAVAARTREIGILRSVGFRPYSVFLSFLLEAALLGLIGGVCGCMLVTPLHGIRTGTMNMDSFSETAFAFRITPTVLVVAVAFAVALGLIGGAIPAWRASRLPPTVALRRG